MPWREGRGFSEPVHTDGVINCGIVTHASDYHLSTFWVHPQHSAFIKSLMWVCVWVAQSCPTVCSPMNGSLRGSSVRGILQARILEWVSLSLLQGIFPTQGLNPGFLHFRRTLYHLSHQGNPFKSLTLPPFLLFILFALPLNLPAAFKSTAPSISWTLGEWGDGTQDWTGVACSCEGGPCHSGAPWSFHSAFPAESFLTAVTDHPGNRAPIDSLATMPVIVRSVLLNHPWRGRKIHALEKAAHGS